MKLFSNKFNLKLSSTDSNENFLIEKGVAKSMLFLDGVSKKYSDRWVAKTGDLWGSRDGNFEIKFRRVRPQHIEYSVFKIKTKSD